MICTVASTLLVVLGVAFGRAYVIQPKIHTETLGPFIDSFVRWDGTYYRDIAQLGYSYRPGQQSTIHFWPLYPLLARGLVLLTGLPVEWALVLLSNCCFAAALWWLGRYTQGRSGPNPAGLPAATMLACSFLPAGFFFHMAYAEAPLLLLGVIQLDLIHRRAHLLLVALIAGLALLLRPTGAALLLPLVAYVFHCGSNRRRAAAWLALSLTLALGGFVAFLVYCQLAFGNALAPIEDRVYLWRLRPLPTLSEKLLSLVSLDLVWEIFDPSADAYWGNQVAPEAALFALYPANPLYFLGALGLFGLGIWRGWLTRYEVLLTAGLLGIPYAMNAYETQLVSMARYDSVAAPLYLVLGRLLARLAPALLAMVAALGGFFLAAYAALFATGYWMI
jgi:hypothetical protein